MTAVAAVTDGTRPGSELPLGATVTATGTNFAVASGAADGMLLCLFDEAGAETRIPSGTATPACGTSSSPASGRLLLDPYARAVSGTVTFGPEVLGYSGSAQEVPPWDVGQADSYDLGRFPPAWRQWNGRYRDTMRDFWRSHPVGLREFAARFCGSADMHGRARRRPTASVNLITVHDGFTLRGLVSYNDKHNEANNQANHDGTDDNRQAQDTGLLEFPRRLIALRQAHPVFRRNRFLAGADARDLRWFTPAGTELTDATWSDPNALAVPLYLDGCDVPDRAAGGTWLIDDNFASGDPIAESPVEGDDSCGRNTSAWRPEEADHESPRSTGAWLDGSSAAPAVPHRGRRAGGLHRPVRIDLLLLRR